MIGTLHFLRPYWLLLFFPILYLSFYLFRHTKAFHTWRQICDEHLLKYLVQTQSSLHYRLFISMLVASLFCLIISLAGIAYIKLPVPIYQPQQARILVLDLSNTMLAQDIKPSRLQRAKFKLRDLLRQQDIGQFGLIVYTKEAFVVSPLTHDGQTIDALIASLTPNIMPVDGNQLELALMEAQRLLKQARMASGQILVLTAETPSPEAIDQAKILANHKIQTSILPILPKDKINLLFETFAKAGSGYLIEFTETTDDIQQWIQFTQHHGSYQTQKNQDMPVWRDDGRWFLLLSMLLLLPLFRRGMLERIRA